MPSSRHAFQHAQRRFHRDWATSTLRSIHDLLERVSVFGVISVVSGVSSLSWCHPCRVFVVAARVGSLRSSSTTQPDGKEGLPKLDGLAVGNHALDDLASASDSISFISFMARQCQSPAPWSRDRRERQTARSRAKASRKTCRRWRLDQVQPGLPSPQAQAPTPADDQQRQRLATLHAEPNRSGAPTPPIRR